MLKHLGKVGSKLYSTIPPGHLMLGLLTRRLVVFTVAIVRQENWRRIHNIPISEEIGHQRLFYCCKRKLNHRPKNQCVCSLEHQMWGDWPGCMGFALDLWTKTRLTLLQIQIDHTQIPERKQICIV